MSVSSEMGSSCNSCKPFLHEILEGGAKLVE